MKFSPWPKRDPIKNFFPVPNELYHLGLSSGEIAIYGYLLSIENRETYQCYPSYKTIGKAVRMSENTVRKYVKALEDKHLITTQPTMIRTKDGRAQNGSLLYTIRPMQEAVEDYYQRQTEQLELDAERQRAEQAVNAYDRRHGTRKKMHGVTACGALCGKRKSRMHPKPCSEYSPR